MKLQPVIPQKISEVLKQEFEGTVFEGIINTVKVSECIRYEDTDFETNVIEMLVDPTKELENEKILMIIDSEIEFADIVLFKQAFYKRLSSLLESNFSSDTEIIEYAEENNFKYYLNPDSIQDAKEWLNNSTGLTNRYSEDISNLNTEIGKSFCLKSMSLEEDIKLNFWEDKPEVGDYFLFEHNFPSPQEKPCKAIGKLTEESTEEFQIAEDPECTIDIPIFDYKILQDDFDRLPPGGMDAIVKKPNEVMITASDEQLLEFYPEKPKF